MTREEEIEQEAGKAFPLPPLYNEEQRRSKEYAQSWAMARDQQWGFQVGAEWADKHPRKGLLDIDKVCEYLKTLQYQEYSGGPMIRLVTDEDIENLKKRFE